jgi:hypothetical protein
MSITKTKEQIWQLADESGIAEWYEGRWDPTDLRATDLHDLADSHTVLLEVAKGILCDGPAHYRDRLYAAIEQAEGESVPGLSDPVRGRKAVTNDEDGNLVCIGQFGEAREIE